MTAIYLLIDPITAEVRYVGKASRSIPARMRVHYCNARKDCQLYSSRWMRSLLVRGLEPIVLVLEECEDWKPRERFWIEHYRGAGCRLTNISDGGDGGGYSYGPLTSRHRAKIAAAIKGRKHTEDAKAKMRKPKPPEMGSRLSAAKTGVKQGPQTPERIEKRTRQIRGRAKSPEHVAKVAAAQRGRPRPSTTGSGNPFSKLTEADIPNVRSARAEGAKLKELALRFGVSQAVISKICLRKSWTHVA